MDIFSGAGNTFVILDGRNGRLQEFSPATLCRESGTDGLMVLRDSQDLDFEMEYYNSDGSGGMMCGNGGRCITAFASMCGIVPGSGDDYVFRAPDGVHRARILSAYGKMWQVRLGMKDVKEWRRTAEGLFIDTGTRHLVRFVPDVKAVDVASEGRRLRRAEEFAPEGTNVDFVSVKGPSILEVRTFEKGVEAETLACGTGVVASAMAAFLSTPATAPEAGETGAHYEIHTVQDVLYVDFSFSDGIFTDVLLTGPCKKIIGITKQK